MDDFKDEFSDADEDVEIQDKPEDNPEDKDQDQDQDDKVNLEQINTSYMTNSTLVSPVKMEYG